jgi:hypothetical protein
MIAELTTCTLVQTGRILPSGICTPDAEVVLVALVTLLANAVGIADSPYLATSTVASRRIITAKAGIGVVVAVNNVACRRRVRRGNGPRKETERGEEQRCGNASRNHSCQGMYIHYTLLATVVRLLFYQ